MSAEQNQSAPPDVFRQLTPLRLGALAWAVYLLINTGIFAPPFAATGDEPHYLLIAHSLAHDFDHDLANDYAGAAARRYTPTDLKPHGIAGPGGRGFYSYHFPALPLLLAPLYRLVEHWPRDHALFLLRLPSALALACAGAWLYLLLLRRGLSTLAAQLGWTSFALCLPVIAYGSRIYPDPFVALLSVLIGSYVLEPKLPSPYRAFALGAAVASFPWFGLKFSGPAAVLGLGLALRLRREPRRLLLLALPALISAAALLLFLRTHFGGFAPDSIYGTAQPGREQLDLAPIWHPQPRWLIPALAAFFLDQRIGLFWYAPIFLLALPGMALLWRRQPRLFGWLGLLLLGVLIPHALKWIWGGSCPPGRPLLPVMWVFALWVAEYAEACPRRGATLLACSLILAAVSIGQSRLFYGATHFLADQRGRLWAALSAPGIDLTKWMPHLIGLQPDWGKLALGVGLLSLATILLLRPRALLPRSLAPLMLALLSVAGWVRGAGWGDPMAEVLPLDPGSVSLLQNASDAGKGIWVRTGEVRLLLTQSQSLEQLELRFGAAPAPVRISGDLEGRAFQLDLGAEQRGRVRLRMSGAGLRAGGDWHYRLRLRITGQASRIRLVLQPHRSDPGPSSIVSAQKRAPP